MADIEPKLAAAPALPNWRPVVSAAVTIDIREDLTIAGIAAFAGRTDDVAARLKDRYGVDLPMEARQEKGDGEAILQWAGRGQWLVLAPEAGAGVVRDLEDELAALLAGVAAVVDQTDARAVMRVSGPRAREVLAKVAGIDLHPRAFAVGDVAITQAAHVGVTIAHVDDLPTFEISLLRSFADSFAQALVAAAGEFVHAAHVSGGRL